MSKRRKQLGATRPWVKGVLGVLGVALIGFGVWIYPVIRDLSTLIPHDTPKVGWTPETEKNLEVLYTALKVQHDSDGMFAKSDGWMDKVLPRVRTDDLKKGAEKEKFIDPAAGGKAGEFGFAMNDSASGKYIDDIKDKKMPLVFQSTDTKWNAHGDPAKIGRKGGIGMSVEGKIVHL